MTILTVLFSILLVLDCAIVTLLVLIQLPKKEAGVGVAFGSTATDALFGAGSGTALTKLTKYSTVAFFVLVILLSMLNSHSVKAAREAASFTQGVEKASKALPTPALAPKSTTPAAPASNTPAPLTIGTNISTNLPAPVLEKPSTNPPPAKPTNAPAAPGK